MTEELILNVQEARAGLIDRVEVLEKVKALLLIPGTEFATVKQVAEFYEVDVDTIKRVYQRNREEIDMDGVCVKSYKEFLTEQNVPLEKMKGKVIITYFSGEILEIPNRGINVFPRRAILRVGMLLRDSIIAEEVRTQLLNIEEKTSNEVKVYDINKEEILLANITRAYASGNIHELMKATTVYRDYQNRYIKELEAKAKIVDEMVSNNSSITTAITQKLKNTQNNWKNNVHNKRLGEGAIAVLMYIHDFINEKGYSPSVREVCTGTGLKSTSSVSAHIERLNDYGYLVKDFDKPRSIRVNEDKYVEVIR